MVFHVPGNTFFFAFWFLIRFALAPPPNSRVPEIWHKMDPVGRGAKSIFPSKRRAKLRNGLHPRLDEKISYNIFRSVSFFRHLHPEAQKLGGRAVAYKTTGFVYKKLFFRYRALWGPRKLLPGSLRRLELRAEMLRCWEAEMLRCSEAEMLSCWVLRAPGIPLKRATKLSRIRRPKNFWGTLFHS